MLRIRRWCRASAGFVMSMYSLLRSKPEAPTEEDIEEALAGNLWCAPSPAE